MIYNKTHKKIPNKQDGHQVASRYTLKKEIGKGMYGSVYKAIDKRDKKAVAIKICHRTNDRLAQKEIEILKMIVGSKTEESGLIQIKDHYILNQKYHMVFEMLGNSVQNYLGEKAMTLRTIKKLAYGLCNSLKTLAEIGTQGIIHGDLKPDNIVFSGRNISNAKIIDFGLAQCDSRSRDYPIQALLYRAPEVFLELEYGKEADMWSLGCVLFAMLTQQSLIRGKNEFECMGRIVEVFGLPPTKMVANSNVWNKFFKLETNHFFVYKNKTIVPGSTHLWDVIKTMYCDGLKKEDGGIIITPKLDMLLDLIKRMLEWDPSSRINPHTAMEHPFFLS